MSAKARLNFKARDQTQQKAELQFLAKCTQDTFWSRLCLEYEEGSKPQHVRFVEIGTRMLDIHQRAKAAKKRKEAQAMEQAQSLGVRIAPRKMTVGVGPREETYAEVPRAEPLSAPPTPNDIVSLRLGPTPCYFRLPVRAFRFASQIFSGKSYEEAVAEQKTNFSSWAVEGKVRRIQECPEYVFWRDKGLVHKDALPDLTARKEQQPPPLTSKSPYQKPRTMLGKRKSKEQ